jgi:arylsulfatase A-like enzyme
LYLAYNAPHTPYEAPSETEEMLNLRDMRKIANVPAEKRRTYAAMVVELDKGLGEIMKALDENRLKKNTLVFFLSDNGGGPNNRGYASCNFPLRGSKGTFYEGGIRVPFIAYWDGKLSSGTRYEKPVISMDISATTLSLAGGDPEKAKLDGINLIPYLTGEITSSPHEKLFWRDNDGKRGAIRKGDFKLKFDKGGEEIELFNVTRDLREENDISNQYPEMVETLMNEWKTWSADMRPSAWEPVPQEQWTQDKYQQPVGFEERVLMK